MSAATVAGAYVRLPGVSGGPADQAGAQSPLADLGADPAVADWSAAVAVSGLPLSAVVVAEQIVSPDYELDAFTYAAGLEALIVGGYLSLVTPLTLDAPDHLADVRTDARTCTTCGAPARDHRDEGRDQCRACWGRA